MSTPRLRIMVSNPIPSHPANEAGTSWKFLIVAESSLTALEGFFHKGHGSKKPKTQAELQERIQERTAAEVADCLDAWPEFSEFVSEADFLPLAIETYRATPRQAMPVAEKLFGVWEWYHGLTEEEQQELLSALGG